MTAEPDPPAGARRHRRRRRIAIGAAGLAVLFTAARVFLPDPGDDGRRLTALLAYPILDTAPPDGHRTQEISGTLAKGPPGPFTSHPFNTAHTEWATPAPPDQVAAFFARTLTEQGWQEIGARCSDATAQNTRTIDLYAHRHEGTYFAFISVEVKSTGAGASKAFLVARAPDYTNAGELYPGRITEHACIRTGPAANSTPPGTR